MSQPEQGGCLCGKVTYELDRDAVISTHHCHCSDCQTVTGSGKATFVMVPAAAFHCEGDVKTYTVTGTDGAHVGRAFCPECGTALYSALQEMPDVRFVKAGTLRDAGWVRADSSFWQSSAQPWSPVDPAIPAFDQNPTGVG